MSNTRYGAAALASVSYQAGRNTTTGGNNTFLGRSAGLGNTTGSGNIYIGANAGGVNSHRP